jgi:peptide/nickel transport system ATP-binding protein
MSEAEILLRAVDLEVSYRQQEGWLKVLHRVNFTIRRGETFGLVGESGCGKSTVALQLLGYRHPNSRVEGGHIEFGGRDLLELRRRELDRIRGDRISFVPQNPTTALNPGMKVGDQVTEILLLHKRFAGREPALKHVVELFGLVGLPTPQALVARYPHQLSGGQQQRVCIAMALACDPDLVVLDEPTTGLDVTTQEQIVELLTDLRRRINLSMLYVTHDLGLLSQIADRVGVMYAGHMVEIAPVAELFHQPRHPYTRGLIGSIPRIDRPDEPAARPLRGLLRRDELPVGCPFQPRCDFAEASCAVNHQTLDRVAPGHEVACQRWRALLAPAMAVSGEAAAPRTVAAEPPLLALDRLSIAYGAQGGAVARFLGARPYVAVRDIDLTIARGETLALVGESGSGKSTIARTVSGLLRPHGGQVLLNGQKLAGLVRERSGDQRREIQYIFQNPDASLNPRARIGSILARPLEMFFDIDRQATRERVLEVLADVRLDAGYAERYADQLSGGERQRVAIARALVARPTLLLCDEVLSALDVSVQASILDLLRRLRAEHQVAMLFISHDLAVVRSIADKVGVLFQGQLMEVGRTADIFSPPFHPYTYSLLMAVPDPDRPRRPMSLGRRSAAGPPKATGCPYAGRCAWQAGPICERTAPPWRKTDRGVSIYCHLPLDELTARAQWVAPDEPSAEPATPHRSPA